MLSSNRIKCDCWQNGQSFPATSNIKASKCITISVLFRQAVITRGTSAAQHPELPFTEDFQSLRPEVDVGSTGATLATAHPSFTQLPLMSVHRWGRENKHWFLFHTRAAAPFSSAVSCQQRTKLVKPHNPLIMICFLTRNFIPNHSKRWPQADTGHSPRALNPVYGALGENPFMLPYRMHIPLALQRGSLLLFWDSCLGLFLNLSKTTHTEEQAEKPRDAFKTSRKAGKQEQSSWHWRLEGWSEEHLQALSCLADRHLHKFKKTFLWDKTHL